MMNNWTELLVSLAVAAIPIIGGTKTCKMN